MQTNTQQLMTPTTDSLTTGSLNSTPSGERLRISLFGRRNAGKSSLINALTGQYTAIVSDTPGTTTDPVSKAMELLPVGPVILTDTPGLDDEGTLGELRVASARVKLRQTDFVLLVADAATGMTEAENVFLSEVSDRNIPYLIVWNKCDLGTDRIDPSLSPAAVVSAAERTGIEELKQQIITCIQKSRAHTPRYLIRDLLHPGELILLVVPIDTAAPKGRLILPQQQTVRDTLEAGCAALVVRDTELDVFLKTLPHPPALVVTDSQVFNAVSRIVPDTVQLTSFSILFARYKGDLPTLVQGARTIDTLADGDRVLISEGCTHHRQCDDIGTVKLPRWLRAHTGKQLEFTFTGGGDFPETLSDFQLIIHCGGCMLNEKEMHYRLAEAKRQHIPITNYGTAIAHINGILERSLQPFCK